MSGIPELVAPFLSLPEYDVELYRHKKMKSTPESAVNALLAGRTVLESTEPWTNEEIYSRLKSLAEAKKVNSGTIMWPVRTALSGLPSSAGGATQLAVALGKNETLARIGAGIAILERALA